MTNDSQSNPLCFHRATRLVREMRDGHLSARDLMAACLNQIDRLNPEINAIPTQIPTDKAMMLALDADEARSRGKAVGPLHGLPIAIKDLVDVAGLPTTFGSPLFADNVPTADALIVQRIRAAGALIIGKTNVPEFGLGSHTFNRLFGTTANPYNPRKTAGGSSGGAAAALATGMLPIADGSDHGGSLRNPAAFNSIFALRPSIGRVPSLVGGSIGRTAVQGALGRSVGDAALLLSVMAGHDPRDPVSINESGEQFATDLDCEFDGVRVAWGGNLGFLEIDHEVMEVCERSLATFETLNCNIEEGSPDLRDAMAIFEVQRSASMFILLKRLESRTPDWRDEVKDTVIWNIDQALQLTARELVDSDVRLAQMMRGVREFFDGNDFLVLPTTQVPPFDKELDWVHEINERKMETYLDWMASCCVISITGLPAASVPCGFTDDGLPVGLQIVGGPGQDLAVLQMANSFEKALEIAAPKPLGR